MKKILFTAVLIFLSCQELKSQWYPQFIGTGDYINQIQFINEEIGFATSLHKRLYKTTDSGANWSLIANDASLLVFSFINENIGWYTSRPWGKIKKTTDGGITWNLIVDKPCEEYFHIKFIDENVGFLSGTVCLDGGVFLKTTNGGMNWNRFEISQTIFNVSDFNIIDSSNYIIAKWGGIFKTTNSGSTWIDLNSFPDKNVYQIHFITPNLGWIIVQPNLLYKTTNGGNTWILQNNEASNLFFVNLNTGWITYQNKILKTTNGGNTWVLQSETAAGDYWDIFFINQNKGWAVGDSGTILYTNNGGLPVELNYFSSNIIGNTVELIWETASEVNNLGFEVQRLYDLSQNSYWEKLDFIDGKGTTTEKSFYKFKDENIPDGKYSYRLKQIDFDGENKFYNLAEQIDIKSYYDFILNQNYPNPFNPSTEIQYSIPNVMLSLTKHDDATLRQAQSDILVSLKVYDILGNEVATLVNENQAAGSYKINFNTSEYGNLSSGIYYYQITAGSYTETKKMILIK